MTRIVLVGGGTGGHFYPLMAVAEALINKASKATWNLELFYIGPDPYDKASLDELGIRFLACPSGKMRRYRSILNVLSPFLLVWGILVAIVKLFRWYPDVVMSKGGYTSVPVIIAAWLLWIPIVIHESDTSVGRANRLGAKLARYIGIAYPSTTASLPADKTALVGIPIRRALLEPAKDPDSTIPGLDPHIPLILVLGGSSGAERVNNLILESLDDLLPNYAIVHQTGAKLLEETKKTAEALVLDATLRSRYHPVGLLSAEELNNAYGRASIVISRAGSTTIFENAVHGMPAILIPIPEDISHDQRSNAYEYARSGGAIVMEEGNLRDGLLAGEIKRILEDEKTYRTMSEAARSFAPVDSAEKVADALISIGGEH